MRNGLLRSVAFLLSISILAVQPAPAQDSGLLGFSQTSSARQRELEQKFDTNLKRENLRDWMKRLSARPHHVGSAYGKQNAEFIASLFRSWGYETEIERFDALFPTPK